MDPMTACCNRISVTAASPYRSNVTAAYTHVLTILLRDTACVLAWTTAVAKTRRALETDLACVLILY